MRYNFWNNKTLYNFQQLLTLRSFVKSIVGGKYILDNADQDQSNVLVSTLIWVSFLGIHFEVGGGGLKSTPHPRSPATCLKLVRVTLETHSCVVSENIPFSIKVLLILPMSTFFCKKIACFSQNSTFTQSNSVRAVLKDF